jgi:hypothetical protein
MKRSEHEKTTGICPFVADPCEDCFCANWNSSSIINALFYCRGSFCECSIYKQLIEKGVYYTDVASPGNG